MVEKKRETESATDQPSDAERTEKSHERIAEVLSGDKELTKADFDLKIERFVCGKMSPAEAADFDTFLEKHPELWEDAELPPLFKQLIEDVHRKTAEWMKDEHEQKSKPQKKLKLKDTQKAEPKIKSAIENARRNGLKTFEILTGADKPELLSFVEKIVSALKADGWISAFRWNNRRKKNSTGVIVDIIANPNTPTE